MMVSEKKTLNRIAIVIPYYGKLPQYFNYFLKSISGKIFDVLFVSDLKVEDYPENFRPVIISINELKIRFESKLGVEISLVHAYKLCDYRPMYGVLMEDVLSSYSYWGWGDCDVIYGREMNRMLDRLMAFNYDVISLNEHWVSGSFALLRNTETCRHLFESAKNLVQVYKSEQNQVFDEIGGWWHHALRDGRMSFAECEQRNDSFTAVVRRSSLLFFHENLNCEEDLRHEVILMRKDGALFWGDKEIPMFHFIEIKNGVFKYGLVFQPVIKVGTYRITRFGFFCSNFTWRLRYLIMAYRWSLFELAIIRFYLAHARRVGLSRTISSFCRQSLNRIRRMVT